MDNRDTCSMKDRKQMDADKVWQWRILHAKKYSRHPKPFYHCNRMGLDFNVASNTQKKIDPHLLTNGVIRELFDFAKTVQNGKKYFITNILENNFGLGLENEQQRKDFTNRIHNKVKDLTKRGCEDKKVFTLFDTSSKPEYNNGLSKVSTELKTESSFFKVDDTDDKEHEEEFKFSQPTPKEDIKTDSVSKEMGAKYDDDELECSGGQPAEKLTETVLPPLFPCCEEIGLNLDAGSKQILDPGLLTTGVMLELVYFTKILTGTQTFVFLDVLEHNFELDLKSQKEKVRVHSRTLSMLDRRKRLGGKMVMEFENEPFFSRKTDISALPNMEDHLTSTDMSSTLPTVKSNVNPPFTSQFDDKGLCGGETQTQISRNDVTCASTLPTVNSNVNPSFTSQPDDKGLCGGEAQTQISSGCDMEPEEMETENNMWKLRTNRVKQIVSGLEVDTFQSSKKFGLEFNVGFGQKQNISVQSLPVAVLIEIAKFASAVNSSQQDFIMEILEYNFDFGLQSQQQKNVLTCEIMNRVGKLRSCEDAVKFSREIFELPGPLSSVNMVNQSGGDVNAELNSVSRMEESDVAPVSPPHSHAEIKKHISQNMVDLYSFCKEIGLKLQVNNRQTHKKLDINKLTNGAMTEVIHFAEKLCGTFEQICLDIIRHNFDLDSQRGDFDLARSILARITSTMANLDCQNHPNLDTCCTGSTQAAITDQDEDTSTEIEHLNELEIKLWKLRANHIQQILSVPHAENCPRDSYSRCKKLGIDFNVGSGVKQNLDLNLLTNGIMAELNTFVLELISAQRHFITEILEYNFHLDFNNELHRNEFTQQIMAKIRVMNLRNHYTLSRKAMLFELPDASLIQESTYGKTTFCPKCFQDRNHKLLQDESDPGHMHHRPHNMTDTVSAIENYTAQKPAKDLSSTLSAIEETIMDSYPLCKKIGLNLCVDKDKPKDKLDTRVITRGAINEVANFARKLCGAKIKLINDILEHNFKISMQGRALHLPSKSRKITKGYLSWSREVFVIPPLSRHSKYELEMKREAARQWSEWKQSIKKGKLALQMKKERRTRRSHNISVLKKSKKKQRIEVSVNCFPICTAIGLDLDLTLRSGEKEKMDLKLLTNAVVLEIHSYATSKTQHYLPDTMFEILDYNFDLSSQHYRRWEFSKATTSKVQSMVKQYSKIQDGANEIFELPFVYSHKRQKMGSPNSSLNITGKSESSFGGICVPFSISTDCSTSLPVANSNVNLPCESQPEKREIYGDEDQAPIQRNIYTLSSEPDQRGLCGGEAQTEILRHATSNYDMEQEEMATENNLWKLRANRVKQILSTPNKMFNAFNRTKYYGVELNVGYGPKQNISVDCLSNALVLEVAKFALAMNSSQQDFIMEILEYNFDFGRRGKHQRNALTCEIMNRVRRLRSSEDVVKFSREAFELPGFMSPINMANQSVDSVNTELFSLSKMEECGVAPLHPPHSHAETKEDSQKTVGLYPFCKEIGLKLHVKRNQPSKKLNINKLTNGAMTEVTNFAERLCGTFEQICLDILRHNFDLDSQSGDSDLARIMFAKIAAGVEQMNLANCCGSDKKVKGINNDSSTMVKLDCPSNPNLDACSAVSSQAEITDQNEGSSTDPEYQDEHNLQLWKLRASHIQQILSVPHVEHCPLYSYSRCKKLGIDFNVGSGVKQNLDPKLLTNGIMAELNTFATELLSAQKHFVTEILEYNFHLDFDNELHRRAFAKQAMNNIRKAQSKKKYSTPRMKMLFELPDLRFIKELTTYCPKCYQDRNHKLYKDESDLGYMHHPYQHTMTDTVSADANCTAVKYETDTSSTLSATEERIMNSYPRSREVGFNLCVDKDQPKKKLHMNVLTCGIVNEVASLTKKLCGTRNKVINDVLEHNFNINMKNSDPAAMFARVTSHNNGRPDWFNEVYLVRQYSHRPPGQVSKGTQAAAMYSSEQKETIKKRKLALRRKGANYTRPLGESDLDSGEDTELGNSGSDIKKAESRSMDIGMPFLTTTDISSCLSTVNSNVNQPFASQPAERELYGGEEQTQSPRSPPDECDIESEEMRTELFGGEEQAQSPRNRADKCDIESEEMGTGNNMWKLRANRVKQILSSSNKAFSAFYRSKKFGIEFNVGFGPRKNISIDSLPDAVLLQIAKFALAMNSSQQDFIKEILEYNFDFGLQSQHQRNVFTSEVMNKVRQLRSCEDGVNFSKEGSELPDAVPSTNMANQSLESVSAELGRMEEFEVAPICPPHSHAETKEHVSQKSVDLYPFCKEIGLRLHVNQHHHDKKMDISKLTTGAMIEVTNFAEKLCGTFEEICLDILRHNFDLDLQSGDSDITRNILAQIPAIVEQNYLSYLLNPDKKPKVTKKDFSTMVKLDCKSNPNVDACNAVSSQTTITDQNEGSSTDPEYQDEHNLQLWKLRANHIQQILSVPHVERCPFYSYSRCKKLGIDFNVGSGVKQKLDPKLLTNGIMVELNTFATELLSAQKHFITEILEYNFHLDFSNELHRSAFAKQTMDKIRATQANKKYSKPRMKMLFELPNLRCIQELTTYCPKCYEDRTHKLHKEESDRGRKHHPCQYTMTDTVSAYANCTAQHLATDPSSTFSATEDTIMDSYPHCKETGFKLCVDEDQPIHKLNMNVLTRGIVNEVANFTKKLCGAKYKIINDVLEHNFNISTQCLHLNPAMTFQRVMAHKGDRSDWFDKVYGVQQYAHRQPGHVSKMKREAAMYSAERKETIKKRKLALQTKENDYTCPLGESDLDSDDELQLGNSGNQDHWQNPHCSLNSDIPQEAPHLTTTEISSSLTIVNSNVNQCSASQTDIRGLCGGEEQTRIPRDAPNECDVDPEEMETENNMWKIRANRVKQILSASELGPFNKSMKLGFEFNVGFGPKQNNSVDSLRNTILLEVAKFALAMNSSQPFFIMEILEYNFDLYPQGEYRRNIVACEILNRVRQLKAAKDAVKLSKEIFKLPCPMASVHMANQSFCNADPEINNILIKEECDVTHVCPPHSHAETKQSNSLKNVDLYPFCKEIGLKLPVNNNQPNKKLDISKLTNGAMTEVTNLAAKLCGTFEQICLDIFTHNLDLDLQSGESDFARSLVAQIPAIVEQRNLATCLKKVKGFRSDSSIKLGSSQAAITDQDEDTSTDIEHQNELEIKLWKLRANHIQQILSVPHLEHCPLYSYSRCKKLGIDFNVGSGVKQNLDPKLLTNGIMVELNTFATELLSAQKHFVTEILEYNFDLNFNSELHRNAFTQQTFTKVREKGHKKNSLPRMKMPFELPDTRCLQEVISDKAAYCPKCYQDRNHMLHQNESDPGHLHHPHAHATMDTASAGANCTAQNPAKDLPSTLSAIEETIIDRFPCCKKIGLNLCVDKDQPKHKLDPHVLTCGAMVEVTTFAKKLCAAKNTIIHTVLEHNFDIDMQNQNVDITQLFQKAKADKDTELAWFNEVFVIQPCSHKQRQIRPCKLDEASAMQRSEMKETSRKRQLALQIKEKESTLPSHDISDKSKKYKSSRNCPTKEPAHLYPLCTEIGLDLDVTSGSEEKEKLDLKLLTRAVVAEIHKFATRKTGHYLPHTVFDILDYNFDLSSQHYRRWEFSIATSSKVQSMVKQYRKHGQGADKVFKLPFVSAPKDSQRIEDKKQKMKRKKQVTKRTFVRKVSYHLGASRVHFLDGVKTTREARFHDEDANFTTDCWRKVQRSVSQVSLGCGSPLRANREIKEEQYDPYYGYMNPEPYTEERYPYFDDVKTEAITEDVEHSVAIEPTGHLGHTFITLWPNAERQTESENENRQYYILAPPQGFAVWPDTASNVTTAWTTEGVRYLVPVEATGSEEYSMVTIGDDTESTLMEEPENVPVDLQDYGAQRE